MSNKEAVIVVGDKVIRVPLKVLSLYVFCAGQMIDDGGADDYYKGLERKATLDALREFHWKLGGLAT